MKSKILLLLFVFSMGLFSQEEPSEINPMEEKLELTEKDYKLNTDQGELATPSADVPSLGVSDYLGAVFVLVLVIIVLYAVLKVIRKVGGARIGLDNDQIKVLSTKALKGTTALHLVEVGEQVFLIGATDNSVNRIGEITDKETLDSLKLESTQDEGATNSFITLLTNKLRGHGENKAEPDLEKVSINRGKLDKF